MGVDTNFTFKTVNGTSYPKNSSVVNMKDSEFIIAELELPPGRQFYSYSQG